MVNILSSILVLYSWVVAVVVISFLCLIGRFYEIRFGQRSYYQLLLLPLVLFVAAAVWNVFLVDWSGGDAMLEFVGTGWPDLLLLLGGLVLIVFCYSLFRMMMGGRR